MTCPHCYSQFITLIQFDFGQDQQTGVHDRGEVFECRECKKASTPEEVEAEDIRSFEQAMTAACVLARSAEVIGLQIALRMQEAAGLELRESLALCQAEARYEGRLDWVN
jgi:hypothetical protein